MSYRKYLTTYHEQILQSLSKIMGFSFNPAYHRVLDSLPKRDRQKVVICPLTGRDEINKSGMDIDAMKVIHEALIEYRQKDRSGLAEFAWYLDPTTLPYYSPEGGSGYVSAYRLMDDVLNFMGVETSRKGMKQLGEEVTWIGNEPSPADVQYRDCTVVTCTEKQGEALILLIEGIRKHVQKSYDIGLRNGSDWLTNMAQGALTMDEINNFELERARAKANASG